MKYALYVLVCLFSACTGSVKTGQEENKAADSIPASAEAAYECITRAIAANHAAGISTYIHPGAGLYIIETAGALPKITRIHDISAYKSINTQQPLLAMNADSLALPLKKEPLPEMACDSPYFYTKRGVFFQNINRLKEEQVWKYDESLSKAEVRQLEELAGTVNTTVLNTYNYTYYFSFIGGRWYLTFLDIRVPCSA